MSLIFLFPLKFLLFYFRYSYLNNDRSLSRHLSSRGNPCNCPLDLESTVLNALRQLVFPHFLSLRSTQIVIFLRDSTDEGIQEVQNPFDSSGTQIFLRTARFLWRVLMRELRGLTKCLSMTMFILLNIRNN